MAGGVLRLLEVATTRGFAIDEVSTEPLGHRRPRTTEPDVGDLQPMVEVTLHVHGRSSLTELAAAFSEVVDVDAVLVDDANAVDE